MMILEYGKMPDLPGVVCVFKCDEEIVAVVPFLCDKFNKIMPQFAVDYAKKIMNVKIDKTKKTNLNYIVSHLKNKKKIKFTDLNLSSSTEFQRAIYKKLFNTKPGTTMTYGQLADGVGRKNAARAAGSAMRKNPLPIIVPCHRVTNKSGKENFSIPCLKKKPTNCLVKDISNCSLEFKTLLRESEWTSSYTR